MSSKYDNLKRECTVCHTDFLKGKTESGPDFLKRIYCSHSCYSKTLIGKKFSEETLRKMKSHIGSSRYNYKERKIFKCSICPKMFFSYIKNGKQRTYCSNKCVGISNGTKNKGIPRSEDTRKKLSVAFKGNKSHFWEGGKTVINSLIRESVEYKLWREAVFKRDNFACIECGSKKQLNADHIKPFAFFPELRLAINNGQTLCLSCHKKTSTYGSGAKKVYQAELNKNICQITK